MEVGGTVARAEGRGGGQDQLLFDDAGFGMVLGQLGQTLLQRVPQEVQALGRLAQTGLCLQHGCGAALTHVHQDKAVIGNLLTATFIPMPRFIQHIHM